jgi:hypothetical protein
MLQEGLDRPAKNGLSSESAELLGKPAAEAFAFSRGDNESCNGHDARLAPAGSLL